MEKRSLWKTKTEWGVKQFHGTFLFTGLGVEEQLSTTARREWPERNLEMKLQSEIETVER